MSSGSCSSKRVSSVRASGRLTNRRGPVLLWYFHILAIVSNEEARNEPGLLVTISAVGFLNGPDQCAGSQSANAVLHWQHVPYLWHGHPCHDVQRRNDVPWLRYHDARQLCYVRLLPC